MIRDKRKLIIGAVILCAIIVLFIRMKRGPAEPEQNGRTTIKPEIGEVKKTVTTTGVVEPQNRLEVKPSIGGRIEEMLVTEGSDVKKGRVLAWMSSTERAALIDAARSQGAEALEYWEEAYKKTPIISPIDGEVIVRSVEPGQTITTSDAVLVLSDRLVVSAQFDETDIGRVKEGQDAFVTLDAYPEISIEGAVDHIAYESRIENNVTIYDVDVLPKEVPDILRSGMSVTVSVVEKKAESVLRVPSSAVHYDGKREFVMVPTGRGKIKERDVKTGFTGDKYVEIVSGLSPEDDVVVRDKLFLPSTKSIGGNPFMPSRRNR